MQILGLGLGLGLGSRTSCTRAQSCGQSQVENSRETKGQHHTPPHTHTSTITCVSHRHVHKPPPPSPPPTLQLRDVQQHSHTGKTQGAHHIVEASESSRVAHAACRRSVRCAASSFWTRAMLVPLVDAQTKRYHKQGLGTGLTWFEVTCFTDTFAPHMGNGYLHASCACVMDVYGWRVSGMMGRIDRYQDTGSRHVMAHSADLCIAQQGS